MPLHVMLIGDFHLPEFRNVAHFFRQHARTVEFTDAEAAIRSLEAGESVDVVLLALSHRTRFTEPQIRLLRATVPLSRVCAIVGSWCEGETRSGHPWPGVERLYVAQVIPRAESERWLENQVASSPPPTVGQDERWLQRATAPLAANQQLVIVCGQFVESRQALSDACQAGGFQPLSIPPMSPAQGRAYAVVYDAHRHEEQRMREIRHLRHGFPEAGLVVLVEYPRHQETQQIQEAGGHRLLGKPFDLGDLIASLHAAGRIAAGRESAA